MDRPITEIFIPAYNAEEFLGEAIESALGQTDNRVRVVVVDNASTDSTREVAARYASDIRLEIFANPTNVGMTANLRRCAELHDGGYFTILCADNILKPNYVERMRYIFDANPSIEVVTGCTETLQMPERRVVGNSVTANEQARLLTAEEIIERVFICFNAFMVRPGISFGFDPAFQYSPDEKLWREWAVAGTQVAYLPEILAVYRSHTSNMGKRTAFIRQLDEQLAAIEWIEQDPRLARFQDACLRGKIHVCRYLASIMDDPHSQRVLDRLMQQYSAQSVAAQCESIACLSEPAQMPTVGRRPRDPQSLQIAIQGHRPDPAGLATWAVTYQAAQFLHLADRASVAWPDAATPDAATDALIVYDECALLADERLQRRCLETDALVVYVAFDWWCHPAQVAQFLRRQKRTLMVLRHESARRMFDDLAPDIPKVVQRPGVETAIFRPSDLPKKYDILLSGTESSDYPMRQTLNRIVRENADRYGWSVLDLARGSLMSGHDMGQCAYAPALASAKVSPTGTNRGGGSGATLVTQHLDHSAARAQFDHPFYGLQRPDVITRHYDTAGITPRYLESLAAKTLLIGDLPEGEAEAWYGDKMIVVTPDMSDEQIVSILDHAVRSDREREVLCDYAYRAVMQTETSEYKAEELAALIVRYL